MPHLHSYSTKHTHHTMPRNAMTGSVRTGGQRTHAEFVPSTFNREQRTVDVTFGTEKPILTGYFVRYHEILSFQDSHCDLSRLNDGAPMLDNHDRCTKAADQPGVVVKAWISNGKGYATLRFSRNADGDKLMDNVEDGIVTKVSVGYNVYEYEEVIPNGVTPEMMRDEDYVPTLRALNWQPYEISFVSIPADNDAGVRNLRNNEQEQFHNATVFFNNQQNSMRRLFYDNTAGNGGGGSQDGGAGAGGGSATPAPAAPATPPTPPAEPPAPPAAPAAPATPPAAPAAEPVASDGARSLLSGGNTREMQIFNAAEIAGLPASFAMGIVRSAMTVEQASQAIIAERVRIQDGTPTNGNNRAATSGDQQAVARRTAFEDALLHRANPNRHTLTEGARHYRNLDLLGMCRELVGYEQSRAMSNRVLAEVALGLQHDGQRSNGLHSTSDFPIILGNTINRSLRAEYDSYPSTWRQFCQQSNFKDFREKTVVQLSEVGDFAEVKESGEYTRVSLTEGSEKYKPKKYGEIIGVTWEMIINDDLNAFSKLPSKIAMAARRKQDDLIYGIITGNPNMGDGNALFSVAHKNLATASVISVDNLGLARAIMRKQKGLADKQQLNLMPTYLLVGPDLEQVAMQYMSSSFVPTAQSGINPWTGSLTIIVEPRLTGNQWYMIAGKNQIETIEYGFLENEPEIYTAQRVGFDVDGLEVKARMVFGAKPIDWRGFVKNAGV